MSDREMPAEGRFASTGQNRVAGRALRLARQASGPDSSTQSEFAARVGRGLGIEISAAALSNWESGRRSVPTAVLMEAVATSGQSFDVLLARATDLPTGSSSGAQMSSDVDVGALVEEVAQQRREIAEIGRLLARMRRRLEDAGIILAEPAEDEAEQHADAV